MEQRTPIALLMQLLWKCTGLLKNYAETYFSVPTLLKRLPTRISPSSLFTPFRMATGVLRARVVDLGIDADACFWNDREPSACAKSCAGVMAQ